jgi:deoxyribodipyrimidine photo-lyase
VNIALVWFRQDLRVADNPALMTACAEHEVVIPLYIYDPKTSVLGRAQQWWLHHSLLALDQSLQKYGLNLILRQGDPLQIVAEIINQLSITNVYWNRCYEPQAIQRDTLLKSKLLEQNIQVTSFNASLLNEPWTILNQQGEYFKVFTPFWKNCLKTISSKPTPSAYQIKPMHQTQKIEIFSESIMTWNLLPKHPNWAARFPEYWQPGELGAQEKLQQFIEHHLTNYKTNRNIPAKQATSRLSPHLHFGEISPWSIWRAVAFAKLNPNCDWPSADHFLSELGWREFSTHLLFHVPTLPQENFRKEFDHFPWHIDEKALKLWQQGLTGYPIIDAGMRELWATGYMHNRVRMIVASFLTKDLFIDWRLGADWFFDTLVDADLANNSASWQWVAGCGADAAPYFRIFNPVLQSEKFDPDETYIRQWVPELNSGCVLGRDYPKPIVQHDVARHQALAYYQALKNPSKEQSL